MDLVIVKLKVRTTVLPNKNITGVGGKLPHPPPLTRAPGWAAKGVSTQQSRRAKSVIAVNLLLCS